LEPEARLKRVTRENWEEGEKKKNTSSRPRLCSGLTETLRSRGRGQRNKNGKGGRIILSQKGAGKETSPRRKEGGHLSSRTGQKKKSRKEKGQMLMFKEGGIA